MFRLHQRIRDAVAVELDAAARADDRGEPEAAFGLLERAHVLGQSFTLLHVQVHVKMLRWALRHHRCEEAAGQLLRIVAAVTKTAIGWVPKGNTGGSNVSPFRRMPIAPELQQQLDATRR